MATYTDLRTLLNNSTLRNRVEIGCLVAAENIRAEGSAVDNHVNRLRWAKQVFMSSTSVAQNMYPALLAANHALSVGDILAVTDEQIQLAVNAAVDVFADPPVAE